MERLKKIVKSDLYQVGIEGILEKIVNQTNMSEQSKNITRNILRVGSGFLVGAAAWSCYDGQPTVSANPTPINNFNSSELAPTQMSEIQKITAADLIMYKGETEKADIVLSLPENRPENKSDKFDIFKIKVGDQFVNFVMYEVTDEEIQSGIVIKTVSNGEEIYSVQNIALYTEVIEYGGTKRWERLIATNPSLNGDNTVWMYDPNGYPTKADQAIDTSRAVLGYDKDGKNILVQPIIIDPNQIPGYDYTQALPVRLFETPSLMKSASPIKYEVSEETEAPVEVREFVPAETAELSSNLKSHELKFAPDVDLKAIYWDIAVVQLGNATSNSKGLEQNRKVYEEIIKDFPQWEGIGSGTDYKERVAFMKEFLKRTGGTMIVQDHNFNKFEVDFNKPVKFEVVNVDTLPTEYTNLLALNKDSYSRGGGGKIYASDDGQLVYSIAIVSGSIEHHQSYDLSFYGKWKWTAGEIVSDLLRQTITQTAYKARNSDLNKYSLYIRGGTPGNANFYSDVNWTAIK